MMNSSNVFQDMRDFRESGLWCSVIVIIPLADDPVVLRREYDGNLYAYRQNGTIIDYVGAKAAIQVGTTIFYNP